MSATISGRNNITLDSLQNMVSNLRDRAIIRAKTEGESKVEVLYQKTKLPNLFSKDRKEVRLTRQNLAREMIKESLKTAISGYENQIKSRDIKEKMAIALNHIFEKHIPSEGDVRAKDLKSMIKAANSELSNAKELESQRKLQLEKQVENLGKTLPPEKLREVESLVMIKVGQLENAPEGKTAEEVRSGEDHLRKAVPGETRVAGFELFQSKDIEKLERGHVVGMLKSVYENQQVMPLESLKRLMSAPCVKLAVGTLTGANVPRQPKVGDDSPHLVRQGMEELKKLVNEVLTPTEKKELKARMSFLAKYAPLAKSKFGLAEGGENDPLMQNKQWIKSATVSYGLFCGIPQGDITKGSLNVRQTGIDARDLFTALAIHHEEIFADEPQGMNLDRVLEDFGKETHQNPTEIKFGLGDNKGLRQVDELLKELEEKN